MHCVRWHGKQPHMCSALTKFSSAKYKMKVYLDSIKHIFHICNKYTRQMVKPINVKRSCMTSLKLEKERALKQNK
jgi:hypothetical protein